MYKCHKCDMSYPKVTLNLHRCNMTKANHTKILKKSDFFGSNKIPFIQAILSHNQDKSVVKVSETQTSGPPSNLNLSKENKERPLIPGSRELNCQKESIAPTQPENPLCIGPCYQRISSSKKPGSAVFLSWRW